MIEILQQFIVLYVITFCVLMIFFALRKRSKKYGSIPTTGMMYLTNMCKIDISLIGIDKVEKHLILINSFIISVDLLIYFKVESMMLKLFIIFITTFVLIFVSYSILVKKYK